MDERFVNLIKGINSALSEFLVSVDKLVEPSLPIEAIVVEAVAVEGVEVEDEPAPIVETAVKVVSDTDWVAPVAALVPISEPTPDVQPVVASSQFPLIPQDVMKAKRKDLRALVEELGLPIVGPNGEPVSELMVGPLREAIIGHIRLQELQGITTPSKSMEPPFPVAEAVVFPVAEAVVVEESVAQSTSPELANRVDTFLAWVSKVSANGKREETAAELEQFFAMNLPRVPEPERVPLDKYFNKLSCSANCISCPNGGSQVLFCYGIFDEEVTSFSLQDAVSKDHYFKCNSSGDLVHRPA